MKSLVWFRVDSFFVKVSGHLSWESITLIISLIYYIPSCLPAIRVFKHRVLAFAAKIKSIISKSWFTLAFCTHRPIGILFIKACSMPIAIYCPSILLAPGFYETLWIFHYISFNTILTSFSCIRFVTGARTSCFITLWLTMRIAKARRHT